MAPALFIRHDAAARDDFTYFRLHFASFYVSPQYQSMFRTNLARLRRTMMFLPLSTLMSPALAMQQSHSRAIDATMSASFEIARLQPIIYDD